MADEIEIAVYNQVNNFHTLDVMSYEMAQTQAFINNNHW